MINPTLPTPPKDSYLQGLNLALTNILRAIVYKIDALEKWTAFTPVFGSLTVVGATTYSGLYRVVGKSLEFQVSFKAATSIASVAGTDYLTLPVTAAGLSGIATMQNSTTNVAVGNCVINVSSSRAYLPTRVASGNTFLLCGSYQI